MAIFTTEEMNYFINQNKPVHNIPITIRGCHNCEPERWEQQGPSKGTYKCKCRKIVKTILKDKYYNQ